MTRKDAAELAGVGPRTIDQWVHRKLITRHPDGYDQIEILRRTLTRNTAQAVGGYVAARTRVSQ